MLTSNRITIPTEEYFELKEAEAMLRALKQLGVDNWEFYSDAADLAEEILQEEKEKDRKENP